MRVAIAIVHNAELGEGDLVRNEFDQLVEGPDHKLITSPSSSPENNFITDERMRASVCEGAAMDRSIVWDLLNNTAQAAAILRSDPEFRRKLETTRDRIRPLQIGKAGQLMEWGGDWDMNSDDMQHRHVSHLYALHPGNEITMAGTPALAAAARKTRAVTKVRIMARFPGRHLRSNSVRNSARKRQRA